MERRLLKAVRRRLRELGRRRLNARFAYTDATIVEVYLWAVINDRPTCWACDPENWRGVRLPPGLPSASQMSRRLRSKSVRRLRARLEQWVLRRRRCAALVCVIDGHAMEIASHSADRHAGYGRARGGFGKGYKLHMLIDRCGTIWAWRVAPMHIDEREMARRMMRELPPTAYLLADANYNSNRLFRLARLRGAQMLAPRRKRGRNTRQGLGNHPQDPGRIRSIELLEQSTSRFGADLLRMRGLIEGVFGTLTSHANGLNGLRPWIRSYGRVRQWVHAKLIINELRRQIAPSGPV
jgi:hypothetical protein